MNKKTEIIYSFDTENFTSNHGADGIFDEAELLKKHGVKGCFAVTGWLADQLINWKRDDVINALKDHEIDFHTHRHSHHPCVDEYTDIENFDEALSELLKDEGEGLKKVFGLFGVDKVYAAVPPGSTRSYVSMYGYSDMGIPIYSGTTCAPVSGKLLSYCNMGHIYYTYCLEEEILGDNFDCKAFVDEVATKERAVIFTHPHMSYYKVHWDTVNYNGENKHPFGEWDDAPRREQWETERFYKNFADIIDMINNDDRFTVTTYKELAEKIKAEGERKITAENIPEIRKAVNKKFGYINAPVSYCLSDLFLACADLLKGKKEHICGKVYGFLNEPFKIEKAVTVKAEDIKKSAADIKTDGFLPEKIKVGDIALGPADWLRGALAVLDGETEITIEPGDVWPDMDEIPYVRDEKYEYRWVHLKEYKDEYISKRLKLQAWTMRYPNI